MPSAAAESLRAQVLDRWPTLHAFCRAHPELKRSTVYMVLAGQYPGNAEKQLERIALALEAGEREVPPAVTAEGMAEALQHIRCGQCRKYGKRQCPRCRTRTGMEARALFARLFA